MMAHWARVLPTRILQLDYERTVTDLPSVERELLDFVGQPWSEQCVEFHRGQRPVRTASVSQVRQPVYRQSVDRWQHYVGLIPELECLNTGQPE